MVINKNLENFRIILVNTTHPGNVGATARAMKTMGISDLYLVSADSNIIDDHARARSSGATDILDNTKIVSSLKEALIDCHYLLGTSVRMRTLSTPIYYPRAAAKTAVDEYTSKGLKVAIIFGQERMGLTNQEIAVCHAQIMIPANPEYSSLNLASAVQLICYELKLASMDETIERQDKRDELELATANQMELFYEHLEKVLLKIRFLNPSQPKLLMRRLRRLYNRASPCQQELNILRGILTASEKASENKLKNMEE